MADQGKEIKDQIRHLSGKAETRASAREKAFRAIQKSPGDAELRLLLAKLFYLDGYFEFAARELIEVQYIQPTPSVERLLQQFTEYSAPLLARLKDVPSVDGAGAAAKGGKAPKAAKEKEASEDQVIADMDVDLDLFEE